MTVGQTIEHASKVLMPRHHIDEYLKVVESIFHEDIHYVDPVHEIRGRENVLQMLKKYVPRAANDQFTFELVYDGPERAVWKWKIALKIRFTPFEFIIHGLVEALIRDGKIYYQREYYDPMESIGVIPFVGFFYKLILRMA